MITSADGYLFDLDATVFQGGQCNPGAGNIIAKLKALHKRILVLSDQGILSRKEFVDKLNRMGIQIEEHEILLSSTVVARFLRRHYPTARVWIYSGEGLKEELQTHNVRVCDSAEDANWIMISLSERINYLDLKLAFQNVKTAGARIVILNGALSAAANMEVAELISAIEDAGGKQVDAVLIGKSSYLMGDAALDLLGLQPERCVVIGDSMQPTIQLGLSYGMKAAVVLPEMTNKARMLDSDLRPHYIFESMQEIMEQFSR